MRALVGKTERITLEEAMDLRDKASIDFLYYMKSIVDEATDDEEERADISVNMAGKLSNLMASCELVGVLMDDDAYVSTIPHNEGVRIEEVG